MTHSLIGLISFTVIFVGAVIGLLTARYLPPEHLSSQTQTAVNVSVAVIGTLAALVLGLMITTASNSFSARSNEVTELSFQLIRIDRLLRRYGTEADEARA